jgi:hypothetical protein
MVEVVSARIGEGTRLRMRRHPRVNWSQVIREAIEDKLDEEDARRRPDRAQLLGAKMLVDSVRAPSPGWDSTEEIRKWRERRR